MVDLSIVTLVYLSSYVKLCLYSAFISVEVVPAAGLAQVEASAGGFTVVNRDQMLEVSSFFKKGYHDIMAMDIKKIYIYIKYNKTTGDINSIRFDYSINQPKLGHVNNPSDDKSSPFSLKAKPIEETAGRTNQNTPGGRLQIADWRCKVIPDRIVNHSKSLLIVWWFTFLCFGDTVCTWSHLKYLHTGP